MAPLNVIHVEDPGDPRLADYAHLKDEGVRARDREGARDHFIAEGELVVRRLLSSRFKTRSVLVSHEHLDRVADALQTLTPDVPVLLAPRAVIAAIAGFPFHRGILASGVREGGLSVDEVIGASSVLVVLEDLTNHDNIGSIFRSTGALGGDRPGVILSPGCCDPLYRKSLRVSTGLALHVRYARAPSWPGVLGDMRRAGFETIALTPDAGAEDLDETRTPGAKYALVLGSEGPGLTRGAMEACAHRVRIPIHARADSLNVGVAAAVALHGLVGGTSPANKARPREST